MDPTYLEFFGLARAPFATLADPNQQFQSEQYALLMEHLAFAAKNADSLVVVCGADGSGKSTLISRFMGTIRDKVSAVLVDAASYEGVVPFYSTFLKQIGFDEVTGTQSELTNITKEFLVCRGIARDHVLIIIDNTHLADPRILEQLRRLCDVKVKDRRTISVVLFGNADIVRVVDAPAMRQVVFASHVVFNIRNYSEHETASYIRHRLELAGANDALRFSDAVCSLIHRYSGGIPQRISKLCVDTLQEAHRRQSRAVSTEIVRAVINEQRLLPHVTPQNAKGRRRSDAKLDANAVPDVDLQASQERINELATQVDTLETSRVRALQEADLRARELLSLRDELDAQKKEAESLSQSVANHAAVIARQNQALLERTGLFKESEAEVRRLTSELQKELRSRDVAQERLDKANAAIDGLTRSKQELQAAVDAITVELRNGRSAADQRAVETEALARTTAHLRTEIAEKTTELESMRKELASRNAAVTDLEQRLELQALADRAAATAAQKQALSESAAALQASETKARHLAAELAKELRSRDAALGELDKANATVAHLRTEIAEKTDELESLRRELASRNAAITDLEQRLEALEQADRDAAVTGQNQALSATAALQASEVRAQHLASELSKELRARDAALEDLDKANATVAHLRTEMAEKTTELGSMRSELASMRTELASRNSAVVDLEQRLEAQVFANQAAFTAEQNKALSDSAAALQLSEMRVKHLADELSKELRSRDAALEKLDKANATVAELTRSRHELQGTVDAVKADLRSVRAAADQGAVEIETLKKTTADLRTEITGRTTELDSVRGELASRNEALADLELRLEDSRSEYEEAKSQIAALKDPAQVEALELAVQKLGADLETERGARRVADKKRDEATATIQELRSHERDLQAAARKLDAELKASRERAFAAYALETYVTELQKALEDRTSELNARSQAVADLEKQVGELKSEREAIRSRAVAAESKNAVRSEPAKTEPVVEDQTYSSRVVALYERSLSKIPVYGALKKHDRAFYDGLIEEYQVLVGQGLSDKQINDVLRANQAKWMERKLAKASDEALVAYARLLVDQLDEFLFDGTEPCLSFLVPQAKPVKGAVPNYSRRTRERELEVLNMVLATHDARKVLPQEDEVWPSLAPVFTELFDRFGADYVAAIENSYDPHMDRNLLFKVSKALYLGILDMSERSAAAALRWMLSSK